jgi:hypothetical protein
VTTLEIENEYQFKFVVAFDVYGVAISREHKKAYYTVKKVCDFPVPSRGVTNQTLPGRE